MLVALMEELKNYEGKKVYGYIPKKAKNLVNGIVDEIAEDERIAKLYELWYEQKDEIVKTYQDGKAERLPLSGNEEFKSIRNAVLKEAVRLLKGETPEWREKKKTWDLYRRAKELLDENNATYNPMQAVELLKESAMRGNAMAKYLLGKLYLQGDKIPKDVSEGKRWLEEAKADGNEYAKQKLEWRNYQQFTLARSTFRLFHHLGRVLQEQLEKGKKGRGPTESKLQRMIDEKKRAHGIKQ
jgi:hypothetical protein